MYMREIYMNTHTNLKLRNWLWKRNNWTSEKKIWYSFSQSSNVKISNINQLDKTLSTNLLSLTPSCSTWSLISSYFWRTRSQVFKKYVLLFQRVSLRYIPVPISYYRSFFDAHSLETFGFLAISSYLSPVEVRSRDFHYNNFCNRTCSCFFENIAIPVADIKAPALLFVVKNIPSVIIDRTGTNAFSQLFLTYPFLLILEFI